MVNGTTNTRAFLSALLITVGARSILVAQGLPVAPPDSGSRVIAIPMGHVFVKNEGDRDRVVAKDGAGQLLSDSWCYHDNGSYDEFAAFFARFRAAVVAHKARRVAALFRFPFRVNVASTRHITIRTSTEFVSRYDELFRPLDVNKIQVAEPRLVFCRDGMAMLDDGVVWAHGVNHLVLADVLNQ